MDYRASRPLVRPASLPLLLAGLACQCAVSTPLWAYIDPGTGSYVFQIVTAALVGGLVALKVFWGRIWRFFKREPPAPPDDSP